VLVVVAACGTEAASSAEPAVSAEAVLPRDAALTVVAADAAPPVSAPTSWTFAVISDLHLPNPVAKNVSHVVDALIAQKVRFVVVTGDSTNGNVGDHKRTFVGEGWRDVTAALMPLREAGIGVLPVAGNHDAAEPWMADEYAKAFSDLQHWAGPVVVLPSSAGRGHGRAPFSYGATVDGVHLALTHLVARSIEPEVERWLAADLEAAAGAQHRIVFGHVPMSSVVMGPNAGHIAKLGQIFERGRVTMHVAGHEHVVWDEDVALPGGGKVREVLVGCASGFYQYGPTPASKERAHCTPLVDPKRREPMRCTMPNGGAFQIARGRKNRHLQDAKTAFVIFTVTGDTIDVRPMTIDVTGRAVDFYVR